MSEDVDLVVPVPPEGRLDYAPTNGQRLDQIGKSIRTLGREAGPRLTQIVGDRGARNNNVIWEAPYPSAYGTQAIVIEVSFSHLLRPARRVALKHLMGRPESAHYVDAFCFALDADEARAEKVRAAFTRRAIRDYYDLAALLDAGADFCSTEFLDLVDAKLAELKARGVADQPARFGITPRELSELQADVDRNLQAVIRQNEPRFDLVAALDRFDRLWGKP